MEVAVADIMQLAANLQTLSSSVVIGPSSALVMKRSEAGEKELLPRRLDWEPLSNTPFSRIISPGANRLHDGEKRYVHLVQQMLSSLVVGDHLCFQGDQVFRRQLSAALQAHVFLESVHHYFEEACLCLRCSSISAQPQEVMEMIVANLLSSSLSASVLKKFCPVLSEFVASLDLRSKHSEKIIDRSRIFFMRGPLECVVLNRCVLLNTSRARGKFTHSSGKMLVVSSIKIWNLLSLEASDSEASDSSDDDGEQNIMLERSDVSASHLHEESEKVGDLLLAVSEGVDVILAPFLFPEHLVTFPAHVQIFDGIDKYQLQSLLTQVQRDELSLGSSHSAQNVIFSFDKLLVQGELLRVELSSDCPKILVVQTPVKTMEFHYKQCILKAVNVLSSLPDSCIIAGGFTLPLSMATLMEQQDAAQNGSSAVVQLLTASLMNALRTIPVTLISSVLPASTARNTMLKLWLSPVGTGIHATEDTASVVTAQQLIQFKNIELADVWWKIITQALSTVSSILRIDCIV